MPESRKFHVSGSDLHQVELSGVLSGESQRTVAEGGSGLQAVERCSLLANDVG